MPFVSQKQRRFLHAKHPEIAKRWEREYGPPAAKKGDHKLRDEMVNRHITRALKKDK